MARDKTEFETVRAEPETTRFVRDTRLTIIDENDRSTFSTVLIGAYQPSVRFFPVISPTNEFRATPIGNTRTSFTRRTTVGSDLATTFSANVLPIDYLYIYIDTHTRLIQRPCIPTIRRFLVQTRRIRQTGFGQTDYRFASVRFMDVPVRHADVVSGTKRPLWKLFTFYPYAGERTAR